MSANKNNFLIYITKEHIDFWINKIRKIGSGGGFVNWCIQKHGQEYIDEISKKD